MLNIFAVTGPFVPANEPMTLIPYKQLRLLDAKIDVFSLFESEDKTLKNNLQYDENFKKFSIKNMGTYYKVLFSIKNINLIKALRNMNHYIKSCIEAYDDDKYQIVYTSSFPAYCHQVGYEIKAKNDVLWIANFTDPINNSPYKNDPATYQEYMFLEKIAFKAYCHFYVDDNYEILAFNNADILVFICEEQRNFMIAQYLLKCDQLTEQQLVAKSVIVPLNYIPEWHNKIPLNDSQKSNNTFNFAHFGRVYGLRRIEEFIYAIKMIDDEQDSKYKNFKVKQFGEFRKKDIKLIQELEIEKYFEINDKIDYESCINEMTNNDALLVFDTYMGENEWQPYLPSKVMEYSLVKKNVFAIATKKSPTYRLFKQSNAICASFNRKEIEKCLKRIMDGETSLIDYEFTNQEAVINLENKINELMKDKRG